MNNFDILIAQATVAQRQQELEQISKANAPKRAQHGLRHSLGSTFVRVGLRLDPAAGEGLQAFDVRAAAQEGGC